MNLRLLAVCLSLPACRVVATSRRDVKGSYIVKLCGAPLEREAAAALAASVGAKVKHVYTRAISGFSVTDCSAKAAKALKNKPEVCSVRPSPRRFREEAGSAGQKNSGQKPHDAVNFWGKNRVLGLPLDHRGGQGAFSGKGSSIVIIDTGLDTTHQEFSNTDERVVANIADCVAGWRYFPSWGWDTLAAANKTVADTLNNDHHSHGTHVSGTAAGKNVGIAPRADVYHIKAGGAHFSEADELCAMETIADALNQGHLTEKTVLSMSLGGACQAPLGLSPDPKVTDGFLQNPATCRDATQSLTGTDDHFKAFLAKGVAITIAAGNEADDACFYTPAASPSAVTVGASKRSDAMYDFTNYGACVDTMAPGVDIWSSQTSHLTKPAGAQDMYSVKSGTSMATPLVAGTTALFLEALGAGASALDAQYAMLHANKPSVVAPTAQSLPEKVCRSCMPDERGDRSSAARSRGRLQYLGRRPHRRVPACKTASLSY